MRDRAPAATTCDRYEVTAETLALRSPTGAVTGSYLNHGQRVTVQRRGSDSSRRDWDVGADGKRGGWGLPAPRWGGPICPSAWRARPTPQPCRLGQSPVWPGRSGEG